MVGYEGTGKSFSVILYKKLIQKVFDYLGKLSFENIMQ